MKNPEIPLSEYEARRKKLLGSIKKSVGLVFAGEARGHDPFHAHAHFQYLTGIADEPGAILMLDGTASGARRSCLFLAPRDPEVERWDGLRMSIGTELREKTGIASIFRTNMLSRFLTASVVQSKRVACLHPFAPFDQPVSPDLELFQKVAARIPGLDIDDHTDRIVEQRSVKSAAEVRMLQRAVDLTAKGYEEVFATLEPGLCEFDVQETLENTYKRNGSRGTSYDTIVGGGLMATVLHYRDNREILQDGDLVCIDSAGSYRGYTADVTRTLPVNGTYTKRQKEIYQLVLKALDAATKIVKPGVTMAQIDGVARKIIDQAGYADAFFHGIGHHLGMEVHDPAPGGGLKAGAVITIEPGIYLADEALGVRIEDDILVTPTGYKNLSRAIPKRVADIEKRMAAGARG